MTCNLSSKDEFQVHNCLKKVNCSNLVFWTNTCQIKEHVQMFLVFKENFHLLAINNIKHHSNGPSPFSHSPVSNGFLKKFIS